MAKKLWGGRFTKKTDPLVEEFTRSIQYDHKIAEYDLLGSMVHVEILRRAGYLKTEEASRLYRGLRSLHGDFLNGKFVYDRASEDVHTDIQNKMRKKVGDLALKLQTARSRNEQVAFSTKLYCVSEGTKLMADMNELALSLTVLADKNKDIVVPGYTHMQHAQPVYLKDYLLAYVTKLNNDKMKLGRILVTIKLTMGAGALAGTPIRAEIYKIKMPKLGKIFDIQMTTNSLDVVSDRVFVIEVLGILAIVSMHLSRMAEDLIIWSTKEFDFVEIGDAYCTGSSFMPQKKNPDVLELVRGYAGRFYGNLINVLVMMKGIPMSYNRDMQLDKEPLFNSVELASKELRVLSGLIRTLKFNKDNINKHLEDESLYATDLAYYLVDLGIPFKNAHDLVGKLIKYSIDRELSIKDMPEDTLKKMLSKKVSKKEIIKRFDPKFSVESKKSIKRTK